MSMYPDDFRGLPREQAIPAEVRICLDEMQFQDGRFVVCTNDLSAFIDTHSGKIEHFVEADGKRAKDVPVWLCDAVNAYLNTAEGQRTMQHYIEREMEGV